MTLSVIAKISKLGIHSTLTNNVEGELRLYQLPIQKQCEHWVRKRE